MAKGMRMVTVRLCALLLLVTVMMTGGAARAEDGYRLWLRNAPLSNAAQHLSLIHI